MCVWRSSEAREHACTTARRSTARAAIVEIVDSKNHDRGGREETVSSLNAFATLRLCA